MQRDIWRMVSWPAELVDGSLKNSNLKDGFVFYDRDPITQDLTKPDTIVPGKAYWFKHRFNDNVIFSNHNTDGVAVPLVDYYINLQKGWNMIGSPFSFPVTVAELELYTYGYDSTKTMDGWTCLLYTSPSPRDGRISRMPSSA